MRGKLLTLLLALAMFHLQAQEIVNIVLVDDNGITNDIKNAKFFIAIKQFSDGSYRRLDYKLHGPLISAKSYSDSTLKILDGITALYNEAGKITACGSYKNNNKNSSWYYYNDTFKVVKEEKYLDGVLMETVDPDTVKKKDVVEYKDEREAVFSGGIKFWKKFIVSHLNINVAEASVKGGTVLVSFRIDKVGKVQDIFLRKSVEFALDEEAQRIMYQSPTWVPAFQNGKTINAYRVQPITFVKE